MASHKDWRMLDLIQDLGGVQVLRKKIAVYGIDPPPLETMIGWRRRESMPGFWALTLALIAEDEGVIKKVSELRKSPKKKKKK